MAPQKSNVPEPSQSGHVVVPVMKKPERFGAVKGLTVPRPLHVGHGSSSAYGSQA
jgi:hypothetical protein